MKADEFYVYCRLPENARRKLELVRGEIYDTGKPGRMNNIREAMVSSTIACALHRIKNDDNCGIVISTNSAVFEVPIDCGHFPWVVHLPDIEADDPDFVAVIVEGDALPKHVEASLNYLIPRCREVWTVRLVERQVTVYKSISTAVTYQCAEKIVSSFFPSLQLTVNEIFSVEHDDDGVQS